tara:strand:+ start:326 stop:832 length:507 start_codon:yes stop_codon:yes gene_type:complete
MSQLKVNSIIPIGGVPTGGGGGIIQIVQTIKTDEVSNTDDDQFNDISGMSLAITPTSTSSKILVSAVLTVNVSTNSNIVFRLLRGSTVIGNSTSSTASPIALGIVGGKYNGNRGNPVPIQFLDSPSTTSATTYKIQQYHNAGNFRLNFSNTSGSFTGSSTLTLMEVSA